MTDAQTAIETRDIINGCFKRVYNLSLEDFGSCLKYLLDSPLNATYIESSFNAMRRDFFKWWCSLDSAAQERLVERF
ncbi:MAG: hypothetical protein II943_00760 [Victivallales bacterium]|nr:hypothetical protein [Victivallales bacterium]